MSERGTPSDESRGIFNYHIALARLIELAAQAAIEAERVATHDELTGALNRRGLEKYLESAEAPKAMLLVDATNFKAVNDRYGYAVGDQLIASTHDLLRASVRSNDVIARWGGDEFVVILNGEGEEQLQNEPLEEKRFSRVQMEHIGPVKERIAKELKSLLNQYKELRDLNFDLAVGGVEWPGMVEIEDLIAEAEKEMKTHKAQQHQNDRDAAA